MTTRAREGAGKQKASCMVGGDVRWHKCIGKQSGSILQLFNRATVRLSSFTPSCTPKKDENTRPPENLYMFTAALFVSVKGGDKNPNDQQWMTVQTKCGGDTQQNITQPWGQMRFWHVLQCAWAGRNKRLHCAFVQLHEMSRIGKNGDKSRSVVA